MASVLLEEPVQQKPPVPPAASDTPRLRWLPPLVLLAAAALAVHVHASFRQDSRHLWWWIGHDRHAHHMYGLNLAMDLRAGDFVQLYHDFDRLRVWGPLHAVLVAAVELVGGPDHRLATLPSLVGWIMTIWCAFLIPRRMLASGGNAAGLIAACFVALSPAHRAYATDVMYESLGAGLSLAVLYCYLVVIQENSRRWAIAMGLTLTALFLHKYNYWFLVMLGLLLSELVRQPQVIFSALYSVCQRDRLWGGLVGELKQPLNYLCLALAGIAVYIGVTGGGVVSIAGQRVSMQEPHNLVHLAFVVLCIRGYLWWRQTGTTLSGQLPDTLRTVLFWHGGAITLWFLLPKRLSYFLWYLSPANNDQPRDSVPFMHGLPSYLQGLQDDYLTLSWGIYLLAVMLLLGLLCSRTFKPGTAAVFLFFLIGVALTCQHPMLKNRFMHSWIAAGWVIGAAGLIQATQSLAGSFASRLRPWAAGVVSVGILALHSPTVFVPAHAQEGGIKKDQPCPLVITDTYLPALANAKHPTLFCNVSTRFMLSWTFIEYHGHQRFTADINNYKARFENNPEQIRQWLKTTRSDALVVIDIHRSSTFDWYTQENVDLTALKQVLSEQTAFSRTRVWELPEGVTITLWEKDTH